MSWRKTDSLPALPNLAAGQKDLETPRGGYQIGQHPSDLVKVTSQLSPRLLSVSHRTSSWGYYDG